MIRELSRIAEVCDGVRCDMAILQLPDVFERTWHIRPADFWSRAIAETHAAHPDFLFLGEAYWDLEWTLQQCGFDYVYDKRLYDYLRGEDARSVRAHLGAPLDYQRRLARFLENHDENRAASVFSNSKHQAAAVITFLAPGLRFFYEGQLEGRQLRDSVHLCRAALEPRDSELEDFYCRLLATLERSVFRTGQWHQLACRPAWDGNGTWESFVCFSWQENLAQFLIAVNYASHQSQCYVAIPFSKVENRWVRFRDRMGTAAYERDGADLARRGLFLDLPPWGHHVFEIEPAAFVLARGESPTIVFEKG
jgi:hypothetical protein